MSRKRKSWEGRIYLGRVDGKQKFHHVGRFDTKRERDHAVAEAKVALSGRRPMPDQIPKCDAYVDWFCNEYKERNKESSWASVKERLKPFREDFSGRSMDVSRSEAKEWASGLGAWSHRRPQAPGTLQSVVTLYNHAIEDDDVPLPRNPFRGLGRRTKGRAGEPPPRREEFERLVEGCRALGDYAPTMRGLLLFATFTLMRPSELFALQWSSIDFDTKRIRKVERVYRGGVDEPKYGAVTIALTPPARDAILPLSRSSRYVFPSKQGKRLSGPLLSWYWSQVKARSRVEFDSYHATKHYGVHYLWTKLGLSRRAIAAQAGWSIGTVDKMLAIYGHGEVGALEEVDAAFENAQDLPEELPLVPGGDR